jgi:hypothetical protein
MPRGERAPEDHPGRHAAAPWTPANVGSSLSVCRAAREALAARFEPVTLTPRPDGGYRLETVLKTSPAALLEHGRAEVCHGGSCGGGRRTFRAA